MTGTYSHYGPIHYTDVVCFLSLGLRRRVASQPCCCCCCWPWASILSTLLFTLNACCTCNAEDRRGLKMEDVLMVSCHSSGRWLHLFPMTHKSIPRMEGSVGSLNMVRQTVVNAVIAGHWSTAWPYLTTEGCQWEETSVLGHVRFGLGNDMCVCERERAKVCLRWREW